MPRAKVEKSRISSDYLGLATLESGSLVKRNITVRYEVTYPRLIPIWGPASDGISYVVNLITEKRERNYVFWHRQVTGTRTVSDPGANVAPSRDMEPTPGDDVLREVQSKHPIGSAEYSRKQRADAAERTMDEIAQQHKDADLYPNEDTYSAANIRVRYQEMIIEIGAGMGPAKAVGTAGAKAVDTARIEALDKASDLADVAEGLTLERDIAKILNNSGWDTVREKTYETIVRTGSTVDEDRSRTFPIYAAPTAEPIRNGIGIRIILRRYEVQTTRYEY